MGKELILLANVVELRLVLAAPLYWLDEAGCNVCTKIHPIPSAVVGSRPSPNWGKSGIHRQRDLCCT